MYDAPTLAEMRVRLSRALRDEQGTVFTAHMLDDFVIEALADLSLFRPPEYATYGTFDAAYGGLNPADYAQMTYIWGVSFQSIPSHADAIGIPFHTDESPTSNGWGWYAGGFGLSHWWVHRLSELQQLYSSDNLVLNLYGYRDRILPVADVDILDILDNTDFLCVLRMGRMLGYQSLEADRSLYQQWLAATNNTDVSPTQLQGMRGQAEQAYERLRKQAQRPKRVPTTGIQYVS